MGFWSRMCFWLDRFGHVCVCVGKSIHLEMVHTSPLCALGLEFISLMGWNVTSIFYTTVENFVCSKRIVFQGFWNWQKYTKVNRTRHLWVFISIIKLPWYKSCWCSHTQSMPRCPNTPTLLDKLSKHQIYCHNSSVNRKIRFIVPIHWSIEKEIDLASPRKKTLVPTVGKKEKQASPYLSQCIIMLLSIEIRKRKNLKK